MKYSVGSESDDGLVWKLSGQASQVGSRGGDGKRSERLDDGVYCDLVQLYGSLPKVPRGASKQATAGGIRVGRAWAGKWRARLVIVRGPAVKIDSRLACKWAAAMTVSWCS